MSKLAKQLRQMGSDYNDAADEIERLQADLSAALAACEAKYGINTQQDGSISTKPLETSDGSTASYYELPKGASELQHLISERNMNAQVGEIFRSCYRYGRVAHSDRARDIKKIIFYAKAELNRLEKLASADALEGGA